MTIEEAWAHLPGVSESEAEALRSTWERHPQVRGYVLLYRRAVYDQRIRGDADEMIPYTVCLDGRFTADQLEAILAIMRQEEGT